MVDDGLLFRQAEHGPQLKGITAVPRGIRSLAHTHGGLLQTRVPGGKYACSFHAISPMQYILAPHCVHHQLVDMRTATRAWSLSIIPRCTHYRS